MDVEKNAKKVNKTANICIYINVTISIKYLKPHPTFEKYTPLN